MTVIALIHLKQVKSPLALVQPGDRRVFNPTRWICSQSAISHPKESSISMDCFRSWKPSHWIALIETVSPIIKKRGYDVLCATGLLQRVASWILWKGYFKLVVLNYYSFYQVWFCCTINGKTWRSYRCLHTLQRSKCFIGILKGGRQWWVERGSEG